MKRNKKGGSPSAYLIGLILLVAIIVSFSQIYSYFTRKMEEGSIREIRIQNVKNQVNANIRGLDVPSKLNFPEIKVKVKKGEELKESSKALVHDWSDLRRGRDPLFPLDIGETVHCGYGHYIIFEEKGQKISVREYVNFQNENTLEDIGVTHVMGDTDVKIREYLMGFSTDYEVFEKQRDELKAAFEGKERVSIVDDITKSAEASRYAIDTDHDYVTVFVYMKRGYWPKWVVTTVFGAVGAARALVLAPFTGGGSLALLVLGYGGVAVGGYVGYKTASDRDADWDASIFLVPNDEMALKSLGCENLPMRGDLK